MISLRSRGSFRRTEGFFKKMSDRAIFKSLDKYGQRGVDALVGNTPKDSGLTAGSWGYTVEERNGLYSIAWTNTNIVGGTPLIILLQYGHGTGTGGYVRGRDIINPSIAPIFDQIAEEVWKEVTNA